MEHPLDRGESGIPSAWRAQAMIGLLRHLPYYRHNRIEQWEFGVEGIKPTNIRTIGCVKPLDVMKRHKIPNVTLPQTLPQGLTDDGAWKTSAAKEHPPGLSKALAAVVESTVQHNLTTGRYRVCTWQNLPAPLFAWINAEPHHPCSETP